MSSTKKRAIVAQPDDGTIDVPHDPDAEAALIQETRERIAMLSTHSGNLEFTSTEVILLEDLDDDLEQLLSVLVTTDEYRCNCELQTEG